MRSTCRTILLFCVLIQPVLAAAPATGPAGGSAMMEPLSDGSLRYTPPGSGWKLLGKGEDNLRVSYATEDGHGRMDLTVTPQTRDVPDNAAEQMALVIGKGIREQAKQAGREIIGQPRVEKDPRFFLVVHVRMSAAAGENVGTAEERVNDLLHLYRVVGLNLVHVVVSAMVETPEEAAPIHDAAKTLLESMQLTRGVGPAVFPKTNIKITPPIDWKTTKVDQGNGLVATYSSPESPSRQIIVRAQILPRNAREDATKREAILDRMVDQERRTPPFSAAVKPGEEQVLSDARYLRQIQSTAEQAGKQGGQQGPVTVITRYLAVGDVLVSVRSVAEASDEATSKLADALAETIKPIRSLTPAQ